jgi:hypothetical protein
MVGKSPTTRAEVKAEILKFLDGSGGDWDWDDFTSVPIKDPFLDAVRRFCLTARTGFPPEEGERTYCNDDGLRLMRMIAEAL